MTNEDYDAALQLCDEIAKSSGWVNAVKEFRLMTGKGLREGALVAEARWGKPIGRFTWQKTEQS